MGRTGSPSPVNTVDDSRGRAVVTSQLLTTLGYGWDMHLLYEGKELIQYGIEAFCAVECAQRTFVV